jgi:hypothetical protein
MNKVFFNVNDDGFYGVYYINKLASSSAMIAMIGDSSDDRMVKCAVKWLQKNGCNVLAMSPNKKDYGHHNYPLERFEKAIDYLKKVGNKKIGIIGASTTGMLSLVVASYFQDITLTVALSPSDFVMEGFYRDGLDGMQERPGDNESSVSYHGVPLPYLPYAYRHPLYWQMIKKESKESGNMVSSIKLFEESERLHPVQEDEKIKIENICGKIVFIGAEDDVLWNTCKYIERMKKRLEIKPHTCECELLLYKHGTHFVFPESMLKSMLPIGSGLFVKLAFKAAKQFPKECLQTRKDIDNKLSIILSQWCK